MDRYPPQPHYRSVMVGVISAGMAGIALSYATTAVAPTPAGRVSIVAYIADLGPLWPIGFGLLAIALLAALVFHRGYVPALSGAGALFLAFATALLIGSLASRPIAPFVAGSLSLVACVCCWVTAAAYSRSKW